MNQNVRKAFLRNIAGLALLSLLAAVPFSGSVAALDADTIAAQTGVKGGFVVHLGCGDGRLTPALRANDRYIVQGLDTDPGDVAAARSYLESKGVYGPVSVDRLTGDRLPYMDNMVNLLIAEDLSGITMDEIMRVLTPKGVAFTQDGGKWRKTVKQWPDNIDEWTHYLHGPDGNPVAHDTVVGPPRRLQWAAGPRWSRHHDHMASMSALVSSNGRIFYILDEGPTSSIQLPPKWNLIARDAFNGTLLWKRPLENWNTHKWPLKSGPGQIPRRLVAVSDTVYVTLGQNAEVSAIDAVTGDIIRDYDGTASTEEIILSDGVLYLLVKEGKTKWNEYRNQYTYVWDNTGFANTGWAWDEEPRLVMAIEAETGKTLWKEESKVAPVSLAAEDGRVYFHDGESVVCLDANNSEEIWRSEAVPMRKPLPSSGGARLILYDDVVIFAGANRAMTSLDAKTGETLWSAPHPASGHMSLENLIIVDDLVWSGATAGGGQSGVYTGRDPRTGVVKADFPPDVSVFWFHERCYSSKATDKYLMPSRTGIEYIDYKAESWDINHWVRGGCIYGVMPANGLTYAPPHSCACYLEAKLNGFSALAAESATPLDLSNVSDEERLERGPAYDAIPRGGEAAKTEWPTYRHNSARSGSTPMAVPAKLEQAWEIRLGGKLTSPVIANGKVFVASVDTHTLHALDQASGEQLWAFTAGARIDSPPTIFQGRVLFGSTDGYVYCLRASDGALAWRFRAAPVDQRIMSFGQVESVWPVHGSVLVQDNKVYFVAGRSIFLNGGLRLLMLNPFTGEKLAENVLSDVEPETGENMHEYVRGLIMPVALPDVLSSDGQNIYMRSQQFDLHGRRLRIAPRSQADQVGEGTHLFAPAGFLDDSWFHRAYWMYGRGLGSGWGEWLQAGWYVPAGRIMVADSEHVYAYGRRTEYLAQSSVLEYALYAADKTVDQEDIERVKKGAQEINASSKKAGASVADWKQRQSFPLQSRSASDYKWLIDEPPLHVRAMVKANDTLFVAGPPDVMDEEFAFYNPDSPEVQALMRKQLAAIEGERGAVLWAVSTDGGEKLAEYKLASIPVFDGMAAANNQLFISLEDGRVVCMGQ